MRSDVNVFTALMIPAIAFDVSYLVTTIKTGNIPSELIPILLFLQFIIYTAIIILLCKLRHMTKD